MRNDMKKYLVILASVCLLLSCDGRKNKFGFPENETVEEFEFLKGVDEKSKSAEATTDMDDEPTGVLSNEKEGNPTDGLVQESNDADGIVGGTTDTDFYDNGTSGYLED